jgi:hypothetical protein
MVDVRKFLYSLIAVLGLAVGAQAQFIGYVSSQSTTSLPFNASTCTAALTAGDVAVTNIGQGAHWATAVASTGGLTILTYSIQASYDGISFFDISDFGTFPTAGGVTDISNVTGTGYYPVIAVKVTSCTPTSATITIRYSGISLPPGTPVGTAQTGQINKHLASLISAGAGFASGSLRTPFGNSAGVLNFLYTGAGPANSTLVASCITTLGNPSSQSFTFPLQTTNSLGQSFNMPAAACPYFSVAYNPGGASASSATLDYAFTTPGSPPPPYAYSHITTTTATAIKAFAGTVHTLSINLGAAGTVSLFDLPTASCTGTPATNQVAIVTATATTLQTFTYDVNFLQGICLKASLAMDLTVSYQ